METHDAGEKTVEANPNPYAPPASGVAGALKADENVGAKRSWWSGVSLLVLAVLSGVGWRAELEMTTGWADMDWISRVHWAVPAGVLAFIVWVLCVTRVRHPVGFGGALVVFGVIGHVVVQRLLMFACGRTILLFDDEEGSATKQLMLDKLLSFLMLALVPLLFGLLCRGFGVRVRLWSVLGCTLLFMLSWPLADFLCEALEGRSEAPFIHALKSGYVIPLLVLCLGWPVLRARRDQERQVDEE